MVPRFGPLVSQCDPCAHSSHWLTNGPNRWPMKTAYLQLSWCRVRARFARARAPPPRRHTRDHEPGVVQHLGGGLAVPQCRRARGRGRWGKRGRRSGGGEVGREGHKAPATRCEGEGNVWCEFVNDIISAYFVCIVGSC